MRNVTKWFKEDEIKNWPLDLTIKPPKGTIQKRERGSKGDREHKGIFICFFNPRGNLSMLIDPGTRAKELERWTMWEEK